MGPFLEGKEGKTHYQQLKYYTHIFNNSRIFDHLPCVYPDRKCVYELNAVLIHRGISAYSGHYIAHVKDARTSDWYKFNDEEIEKMEGKKLHLGTEEDIGKQNDMHKI